jgi:hypothetical protein
MLTDQPLSAVAMLNRAIDGLEDQNPSMLGRTTDVLVFPDDLREIRDALIILIEEATAVAAWLDDESAYGLRVALQGIGGAA